jgi:1,4-alpha-glucan branching enzyme
MNRIYRSAPALHERDHTSDGFTWIDANDSDNNVYSFYRTGAAEDEQLVVVANLSPVPRTGFRVGLPKNTTYQEILNTDASDYGGSGVGNMGAVEAEAMPWHGLDHSALMTIPPLGVVWLRG